MKRLPKMILLAAALVFPACVANAQKGQIAPVIEQIAALAEYLTTCGGTARPAVVRTANRYLEDMLIAGDYGTWLETASRLHIERSPAAKDHFCNVAHDVLERAKLLDPRPDYRDRSEIEPPPGHLNLNKLSRRIPW